MHVHLLLSIAMTLAGWISGGPGLGLQIRGAREGQWFDSTVSAKCSRTSCLLLPCLLPYICCPL